MTLLKIEVEFATNTSYACQDICYEGSFYTTKHDQDSINCKVMNSIMYSNCTVIYSDINFNIKLFKNPLMHE